jgi:hypothetical protein
VVHRDVKPHNLLVFEGGRVKLADFGIAALLDSDAPAESTRGILGSLPFMAPEQRTGRAGSASDVYAAAVTLAWLVTGELPGDLYVETVLARLRGALGAAHPLVDILARAGAHAPEERPDAAQLGSLLRAFAGDAEVALPRLTPGEPTQANAGRWVRQQDDTRASGGGAPWAAVALTASLSGAAVVWAWLHEGPTPPQESPSIALLRAYGEIPVCPDMPTRMDPVTYPRTISQEAGGREGMGARIVDIDGDGRRDLLFGHRLDAEFRIFWGLGSTLEDRPQRVPAMRMGSMVDAADLDADGHLDLVGVSPEEMAFTITRGQGERAFGPPERVESGNVLRGLRVADWDADGRADLVYTLAADGRERVTWRRSMPDGTFSSERNLTGMVEAFDVHVDARGQAAALVVVEEGHLRSYARLPDGRRAPDASLDVEIPLRHLGGLRALAGTTYAYAWSATSGAIRISLKDGARCRYDFGVTHLDDLGHFDSDGFVDGTHVETCSYCTSNYVLFLGTR